MCYHSGSEWTGSNSNEGVLHIPRISKAGTSPSGSLMSYPIYSLRGSPHPAETQSLYFTAQPDWAVLVRIKYICWSCLVFTAYQNLWVNFIPNTFNTNTWGIQ